jgi:hypothetical protein
MSCTPCTSSAYLGNHKQHRRVSQLAVYAGGPANLHNRVTFCWKPSLFMCKLPSCQRLVPDFPVTPAGYVPPPPPPPAPPPPSPPVAPSAPVAAQGSADSSQAVTVGASVGGAVGGTLLVGILIAVVLYLRQRASRRTLLGHIRPPKAGPGECPVLARAFSGYLPVI